MILTRQSSYTQFLKFGMKIHTERNHGRKTSPKTPDLRNGAGRPGHGRAADHWVSLHLGSVRCVFTVDVRSLSAVEFLVLKVNNYSELG